MLLTDAERKKFADYLEVYADSCRQLMQATGQSTMPPQVLEILNQKHKREIAGCLIVIDLLRNTESVSIRA